jgi:hypothetical protein
VRREREREREREIEREREREIERERGLWCDRRRTSPHPNWNTLSMKYLNIISNKFKIPKFSRKRLIQIILFSEIPHFPTSSR